VADKPETHYAKSGDVHIAYQVSGSGASDLLFVPGFAARVMAEAAPGDVLASSTVKDLVAGSGITFADRGLHALRGVPDEWRLFAVTSS